MVSDLRLSMYATDRTKKRILFPCSFFLPYPSSFLSFFHFFLPVAPQGKHQQRQRWPHREREKERKKAGLSPSRAGRRAFYIRLLLLLQTFDITQDRKEKGKREGGSFLFRPLFLLPGATDHGWDSPKILILSGMKNSYIQSSKESAGLSFKYLNVGILWRI